MSRQIVGLTGAFGSGTSYIIDTFFNKKDKDDEEYEKLSLSDVLKTKYEEENGKGAIKKLGSAKRRELQDYGNKLRKDDPAILVKEVDRSIVSDKNYVIDSFRNPCEVEYFRKKYPEFILIGVFAGFETRKKRVEKENPGDFNYAIFLRDDERDSGKREPHYGQKVSDCFFESDLVISNDVNFTDDVLKSDKREVIKNYLKAFREPLESSPNQAEILMAEAYITGRQSRCIKRRVGAIVANKEDRIVSSGFNSVPKGQIPCATKYKDSTPKCYRDHKREELARDIFGMQEDVNVTSEFSEAFKNEIERFSGAFKDKVKLLDYCRSLHAEENAITGLAGSGVDLKDSTIYVTTHPCNLCANKIVQSGVKNVIYFEPYPIVEAQEILKKGSVTSTPFEGVTFRAFFKAFKYGPN